MSTTTAAASASACSTPTKVHKTVREGAADAPSLRESISLSCCTKYMYGTTSATGMRDAPLSAHLIKWSGPETRRGRLGRSRPSQHTTPVPCPRRPPVPPRMRQQSGDACPILLEGAAERWPTSYTGTCVLFQIDASGGDPPQLTSFTRTWNTVSRISSTVRASSLAHFATRLTLELSAPHLTYKRCSTCAALFPGADEPKTILRPCTLRCLEGPSQRSA